MNAEALMARALSRRVALLVEDDHAVRDFAATVLEETELRVVEADSAEEALDYLRTHAEEVALLFTDVRLPCRKSGVDLARKAHLDWPWIHVIVTSGVADERVQADLPRAARFMPKPWPVLEVLKEAERALQR
jgi:DNA-binding NtrC family response regulator